MTKRQLKAAVAKAQAGRVRPRYPIESKAALRAYAEARRAEGATWVQVGAEVFDPADYEDEFNCRAARRSTPGTTQVRRDGGPRGQAPSLSYRHVHWRVAPTAQADLAIKGD